MYKILIVHNKYQIKGGEDSVVDNEVEMLQNHGHEVFKYIRNNSEVNEYSFVKKVMLPFNMIFNCSVFKDIVKIIKEKEIDIVHVHNTNFIISPAVFYASKKCKVPVIMTVHNFRLICASALLYREGKICEKCVGKSMWNGALHKCYRDSRLQSFLLVLGNMIHRTTGIFGKINYICLSDFNKSKLMSIPQIKDNRVYVKPNFSVNCKIPDYSKDDLRDGYLYFGRIDKTKGIDLLINAFSKMPEKKLVLAGTGPEFDKYTSIVKENGYKNIHFVGWCDKERLSELLDNCLAVVSASQLYEGHPMVIVEAFSYGVPVIAGDIGNWGKNIIDEYNGLKYQYTSEDSLINAIYRFEKMDIGTLRKNAYDTYVNDYTEEINYSKLMEIYKSIV